jgi:hypothetical protein
MAQIFSVLGNAIDSMGFSTISREKFPIKNVCRKFSRNNLSISASLHSLFLFLAAVRKKTFFLSVGEYHDKKERPDHLTTHTQVTFSFVSILEKVKPHYHILLEDSVTKTSLLDTEGQYEVSAFSLISTKRDLRQRENPTKPQLLSSIQCLLYPSPFIPFEASLLSLLVG